MTANIPVLPLAGATLARGFTGLALQLSRLANSVARALQHRRDARMLAGLDRHMLADIGLTRADVSDAFSTPFWEDPTALLQERVDGRRVHRPGITRVVELRRAQPGFRRPKTDRPARQAV